ncbi:MAG TPA: hypothetical protein VED63_04905, partial [Acidimicrobiales bacterium]|nr:hypothetical protein [Acidimicrobiales bacterium]
MGPERVSGLRMNFRHPCVWLSGCPRSGGRRVGPCFFPQLRGGDPTALDDEGCEGLVLAAAADADFVVTLCEGFEYGGVDDAVDQEPGSDRDMGAIPPRTGTPYLDLGLRKR